jgi:hypothetical protein
MKALNFVRKTPHAKPPENQKEVWQKRAEKRREEQKKQAKRAAIQLPTGEIANWSPEQWAEFEQRIGVRRKGVR